MAYSDLGGADPRGANLTDADGRTSVFDTADLRSANLTGARFSQANLSAADLRGANLTYTERFATSGSSFLGGG